MHCKLGIKASVVTPKDWTHPLIQGIVQDGGGYNGKTTQLRRRVQG